MYRKQEKSGLDVYKRQDVYVLNTPSMGLKTFAAVHGSKTLYRNRQTKIY